MRSVHSFLPFFRILKIFTNGFALLLRGKKTVKTKQRVLSPPGARPWGSQSGREGRFKGVPESPGHDPDLGTPRVRPFPRPAPESCHPSSPSRSGREGGECSEKRNLPSARSQLLGPHLPRRLTGAHEAGLSTPTAPCHKPGSTETGARVAAQRGGLDGTRGLSTGGVCTIASAPTRPTLL